MTVVLEHIRVNRHGRTLCNFPGITLLPGTFLLITGTNGSGKSSLLKRLAGILRNPHDGKVTIDGVSCPDSAKRTAFLGHHNGLIPEYSTEKYLRHCAYPEHNMQAVPIALRCFGLEAFRDVPCADLSAGRQKRAALASLMCVRRPVWLLDEPSVFLDKDGQTLLCRAIGARCYNQGVVIATTNADPEIFRQESLTPIILNMADISPHHDEETL